MTALPHSTLERVTERIRQRSRSERSAYLERIERAAQSEPVRRGLSCTNLAHSFAACGPADKTAMQEGATPNIAIISSYNDVLSAHQPYEDYPARIRRAVREAGGVAQFAGGVPAMCDGVTQGQPGMELSLFSRDVIAMSTAIALSHNLFDGALCLGICDKIVPGLLIGSLAFGHLPVIFVPGGPMPSGLPNADKARIRQLYSEGKVDDKALLDSEARSYHGPGTCTFYGTANSNQMLMEVMGLHLPGASFVNPNTPLRGALTAAAARRITEITALGREYTPVGRLVDERAIVNAMVGLLATGGSTNHTIHLVAIAHAAGLRIDWDDFSDLSDVVPLLTRIYPNGNADVNAFQAAGGMALLIGELLDAGLLHADVLTVRGGGGLQPYRKRPGLSEESVLAWQEEPQQSLDPKVLTSTSSPFSADGGIKVLAGNLGRAIVKTSCLKDEWRVVEAPALIFDDQKDLQAAFRRGELYRDFVAVVRFQGPRANGMPELHELTPSMCVVQDRGFKVGLVTDGRMSGASGKVPAAIHVTPECAAGGPLARVRNGDMIRLDSLRGVLEALVDPAEWERREAEVVELTRNACGTGRELFDVFRANVTSAESGAISVGASWASPAARTREQA